MAATDYTVEPNLVLSSNNVGGIGGSLGRLLPGIFGSIASSSGGHMKFKEAQSILTLVDNRSGIQVAAAEGKVIVGSMSDAYNNMVKAVKNYKAQESAGPHGHGTGGSLRVN